MKLLTIFGLGIIYMVGAIPAGMVMKLPLLLTAFVTWLGYSAGSVIIVFVGAPLQQWFMKKFNIAAKLEKPSFFMRSWKAYGLPALGILAPVTIGSPTATLVGLALGAQRWKLVAAISLGVIPWVAAFATLASLGIHLGTK